MEVSTNLGMGGASSSLASSAAGQAMGKEDFLKLLTAQLAHQDPLSPMDNSAFVAQLSQFSSVEQLMNANQNLGTLQLVAASQSNTQIAGLIGKDIEANGNVLRHAAPGPAPINFDLGGTAKTVTVTIRDAQGKIVRTLEATDRAGGANILAWDGKDVAGNMAPAGTYQIEVSAKDGEGKDVSSSLKFTGRVTGVSFKGGIPLLEVGDMSVQVADVIAVRDPAAPASPSP